MLSRVSSSTQHTPRFPQSHVSVWRGDGGEGGRTAHRGEARKDGRMEGVSEGGRESVEPIFVQNGDCGVVAHSLFPSPSRSISPPFGAAAAAAGGKRKSSAIFEPHPEHAARSTQHTHTAAHEHQTSKRHGKSCRTPSIQRMADGRVAKRRGSRDLCIFLFA